MYPLKALRVRGHHGGFTLLELLVTITIGAILMAIAVPSLTTFIQNSRETSEENSLVGSLDYARSEAVKSDASVEVCASTDGATCSGAEAAGAWATGWIVESLLNGTATVLQTMPALGTTNTLSSSFSPPASPPSYVTEVTFQPNGFVQAAAGAGVYQTTYFTLCDPRGAGYARDIEVTAIGAVQTLPTAGVALDSEALTCP